MKIAYNYDKDTLEYIGQEECQIDPLESELQQKEIYIYPANSTLIEPPSIPNDGKKYAIIFKKEKWNLIEDNRDVKYWLPEDDPEDDPRLMKTLGPLPDGALLIRPELSKEKQTEKDFELLRLMRDSKLSECDWTVLPDSPLSEEKKKEWIEYRQKLRDLPTLEGAPWKGNEELIPWPKKPSN